ncbi:hypothetical protein [Vibrio sp.]|uniref:hypothetical protein n=1 Tax=Vibrio sp. TaxID=678 RepID=UPI003AA7E2B7
MAVAVADIHAHTVGDVNRAAIDKVAAVVKSGTNIVVAGEFNIALVLNAGTVTAAPLMGALSDKIGRRPVYLMDAILSIVAIVPFLLALLQNSYWLT